MMSTKLHIMCLLVQLASILKAKEQQFQPEFSHKKDICKVAGQSLQINCTLSNNCSCLNNQSEFQINFDINLLKILHCNTGSRQSCTQEGTSLLNERTVTIFKRNLSQFNTGTYFCQYNNIEKTEDNFHLIIGNKPVGPDDVSCISIDLTNLTCSWTKSENDKDNPVPVRYRSSFYSSPQYGKFKCPHREPRYQHTPRDDTGCSLIASTHGQTQFSFQPYNQHTLYIKATNCLGKYVKQYKVQLNETVKLSSPIVKLYKIEDRSITLMMNLTMETSLVLLKLSHIIYQVSYKSDHSTAILNFTSKKDKNIEVNLPDLIPFTIYTITVRSRSPETKGDKYWSNPVTRNYITKAAAPDAVPDIVGYTTQSGSLSIYLKPISASQKHSANAHYEITVKKGNTTIGCVNVSWEDSTVEHVATVGSNAGYQIELKTVNNITQSRNTIRIQLPVIYKPAPNNIMVEKSNQSYTVSWDRVNTSHTELKTIAVYWCRGNRRSHFCKSNLTWIHVSPTKTNITVPNLDDRISKQWVFAVSYQYNDKQNTEMIFAECYFSSITNVPDVVAPFHVVKGETELQVKPLSFCSYTSRPLQFLVYYKETRTDILSGDKIFLVKTLMATLETNEVIIHNLKPSTKYTIWLSVITTGGTTNSSHQTVQTLAVNKWNSDGSIIIVLGIVGPVLFIGVAVFLFCKMRNKWKQPIEFDLPKIVPKTYNKVTFSKSDVSCQYPKRSSGDSGVSSNDFSGSNSPILNVRNNDMVSEHEIVQPNQNVYTLTYLEDNSSYRKLTLSNKELENTESQIAIEEECIKHQIKEDNTKATEHHRNSDKTFHFKTDYISHINTNYVSHKNTETTSHSNSDNKSNGYIAHSSATNLFFSKPKSKPHSFEKVSALNNVSSVRYKGKNGGPIVDVLSTPLLEENSLIETQTNTHDTYEEPYLIHSTDDLQCKPTQRLGSHTGLSSFVLGYIQVNQDGTIQ